MNILIKKPILVAGISLSFLLWIGQKLTNYWDEIGNVSIFSLICLGGLSYFLQQIGRKKSVNQLNLLDITINDLTAKIASIKNQIEALNCELNEIEEKDNQDAKINIKINNFQQQLNTIQQSFPRNNLNIAILNLSQNTNSFALSQDIEKKVKTLVNFHGINDVLEIFNNANNLTNLVLEYDLLLLIISEDLTQSQKEIISYCKNQQQNLIIVFDDINYTLQEEKKLILNSLKKALDSVIEEKYIIPISSKKQTIKVRRYEENSTYKEWEETFNADHEKLIETLLILTEKELDKLTLSTTYRQAINLEKQIREELNAIRKNKSLKVVEKYQMVAATATFANPVSSLDLLATAAINAQMIVDLSKIYQHPLSLNQAQQISLTLAKVMLKLGIVEISSQTISAILKTNIITFVAGGLIQGISAAYLTRVCALSLIEYYEVADFTVNDSINISKLKEKIQLIFEQNKENNFLNQFVKKTSLLLTSVQVKSIG
ncbi:YcjF family protein [Cyanobacterium aponinum UTEX 3221]|uniref:YcjF family protein n=1 Tax=Cyanobacterium aponinum TaxID=379064 RepID=UPI002B4C16E1|nr:YcjF family protein [Cyanobacterium aponinum]WRL37657.1 YcjF family protein [Cyanobacterium aponinum UTEX 3221]